MEYTVACDCGQQITVTAAQAGGSCSCPCGATVPVPSLSKLRVSAGQTRYTTTSIERVTGMLARGELPTVTACPVCEAKANQIVQVGIQCEQATLDDPDQKSFASVVQIWLGGWFGVLASIFRPFESREPEIQGRVTRVEVPLPVCSICLPQVTAAGKRKCRSYLCQEPAYADIFAEYPHAEIEIMKSRKA